MARKSVPGKFSNTRTDRIKKNESYTKTKAKEQFSRDFFTFKDDLVLEYIEEYNHNFRLLMLLRHVALTTDDGIAGLAAQAYETAHVSGNMKDMDATEYAAYIDYCEFIWGLFGQLRDEWAAVNVVESCTYLDTSTTAHNLHHFLKPESFNSLLETLVHRNLVVPLWLDKLLRKFTGVRIKITDSYEIYGEEIPASYLVTGMRLETLTNLETRRNNLVAEKGLAMQHMNKFGISYKSYDDSLITDVRELDYGTPEAYFFFQAIPFRVRGKAKDLIIKGFGQVAFNSGVDWSGWWCYLKDKIVTEDYIFSQCFAAHDGTNNNYGGLFTDLDINASEGDSMIQRMNIIDTVAVVIDPYNSAGFRWVPHLWLSVGVDDLPGAGEYELMMVGTEVTANSVQRPDPTTYTDIRSVSEKLWRTKKTVSKTSLDSFLVRKIIQWSEFK